MVCFLLRVSQVALLLYIFTPSQNISEQDRLLSLVGLAITLVIEHAMLSVRK